MNDQIFLVTGKIVIYGGLLVCIVVSGVFLLAFYIPDKIAFRKYQKKGEKRIMDYARKTTKIEREKANTYDESNLFSDALWSDICKN